MFTRTFKKPALVLASLATVGILGTFMVYGLNTLSSWAESDLDAYPFMQEDWLRYLLPAKFVEKDTRKFLLTGPSTVRENLLFERFEEEFPEHSIIQGGISLGTLDDVTASLHYIRRAYGSNALPEVVVLGISPRFIANIPDKRPFIGGINHYSPYFYATQNDSGLVLSPKNPAESLLSRTRFLIYKQPDRFRTTIFSLFSHLIAGDMSSLQNDDSKTTIQTGLDRFFKYPVIRRFISNTQFKRTLDHDFTKVLAWLVSPYKYRLSPPADEYGLTKWMDGKGSWWQDVHTWNPVATSAATKASLERFNSVIQAHEIELFVVNMPERDISRIRYDNENYIAYLEIVKNTLGTAHFIDLRDFLHTDEFHDLEHSVYPGSLRLTDKIISFLKEYI